MRRFGWDDRLVELEGIRGRQRLIGAGVGSPVRVIVPDLLLERLDEFRTRTGELATRRPSESG